MPGVTPEQALRFTDPARGELDMVFQFEHVELDQRGPKWNQPRSTCATSRHPSAAGRPRWPSAAGTASTGTTTTSRVSSPASATTASTGALGHGAGTVLHLHRGTPYVYQGEEIGMTNVPFDAIEEFRDIESLNHYAEAVGRAPIRRPCSPRCAG